MRGLRIITGTAFLAALLGTLVHVSIPSSVHPLFELVFRLGLGSHRAPVLRSLVYRHVPFQLIRAREALAAAGVRTRERPLASMGADVFGEIGSFDKALAAVRADEGLFTVVRALVISLVMTREVSGMHSNAKREKHIPCVWSSCPRWRTACHSLHAHTQMASPPCVSSDAPGAAPSRRTPARTRGR